MQAADLSIKGDPLYLPLTHAVNKRQNAMVRMLLDRGADVNTPGKDGLTALMCASSKGFADTLKIVLDWGADIDANWESSSALQLAVFGGHKNIVQLQHFKHEKIMQILLDWGADVNINNEEIGTALHVAASQGHEKIVHLLLDRGADIDAYSEGLHSALQAAAAEGHEKAVQILLDRGAHINVQGGDLGSAFEEASSNGHEAIMRRLYQMYYDPSIRILAGAREDLYVDSNLLSYWR
ncbi:hypothetical protein HFD88_003087 [Aspergillus terreus]|nr:hypothetical protein HFD88_003087 [Aspergillus terreus]